VRLELEWDGTVTGREPRDRGTQGASKRGRGMPSSASVRHWSAHARDRFEDERRRLAEQESHRKHVARCPRARDVVTSPRPRRSQVCRTAVICLCLIAGTACVRRVAHSFCVPRRNARGRRASSTTSATRRRPGRLKDVTGPQGHAWSRAAPAVKPGRAARVREPVRAALARTTPGTARTAPRALPTPVTTGLPLLEHSGVGALEVHPQSRLRRPRPRQ
jgi:hypothetical protein